MRTTLEEPAGCAPEMSRDRLEPLALLHSPIWIFDLMRERMWWANPPALRLWGASDTEELLARDVSSTMSESTRLRLRRYRDAFERGEMMLEVWTFYPGGRPTTVECTCSGIPIEGGRLAMLVEGRILAANAMSAGELRGIEALRHTATMISLYGAGGEVLMRNPAADKALPAPAEGEDAFAGGFEEPDVAGAAREALTRGEVFSAEVRVHTREGRRWHGLDARLTTDPVTGGAAILVNQRDLTALKELQAELAAREQSLRNALFVLPVPLLIVRQDDRRLFFANRRAGELFGLSSAAALEVRLEQHFVTPADCDRFLEGMLEAGWAADVEVQLRAGDGRIFWASLSGAPVTYRRAPALVVGIMDIDRQKVLAESLLQALERERSLKQLQAELVSMASHELRTPLAIVDSTAQRLIRRGAGQVPDEMLGRIEKIRGAVARMTLLIDTTLRASRSEDGRLSFEPRPGDLAALVIEVASRQRELSPQHEIEVDVASITRPVVVDLKLMEHVVGNLLGNAAKFSPSGTRIEVRGWMDGGEVCLRVRDEGPGIPAADLPHVFERSFRSGTTAHVKGSGFGLYLARQLVEMHGGSIEAESEEGRGATFTVRLPI